MGRGGTGRAARRPMKESQDLGGELVHVRPLALLI